MNLLQLLAQSSFITLNKNLMKTVGLKESIILAELCSEYNYWLNRNELKNGYFFSTVENIEEHTTLNDYEQRKAIKNLKKLNILDTKTMGIPAKRYIKINEEQIIKILNIQLSKNLNPSSEKFKELELENFNGNKNIDNKNITNKNIEKEIEYTPVVVNNIPYEEIINYLNMKANTSYRSTTKKTKDLIKARFNDGFNLNDFKIVIDKKIIEWLNNDMAKYLRPETLFGTKFESYLNQPMKKITTKDIANNMDFSNMFKPNPDEDLF